MRKPKQKEIFEKTMKVINSCTDIKHLDCLYRYVYLAGHKITNSKYLEKIVNALHSTSETIHKERDFNLNMLNGNRL